MPLSRATHPRALTTETIDLTVAEYQRHPRCTLEVQLALATETSRLG